MHSYKKESIRLAAAKSSVARAFPFYSENKRHEITRLAFEISQREGASPANVVRTLTKGVKDLAHYQAVKKAFLKRRFPGASAESPHVRAYLPQVYLDKAQVLEIKNTPFSPRFIFYEKGTRTSALYGRFTKRFPRARTIEIESLAAYRKEKKFSLREYNERRDRVFLTNERFDFFKRCPCTKAAQGCGYHVFNLGFGCIFECSYCFLQEYVNAPGILFPANIQRFFAQFYDHGPSRARIGTGEFSDSLMLDDVTQYSQELIDFFRKFPKVIFEFKTKSDNVLGVMAPQDPRATS
jgi:spore photoproduct lyase